MGKRGWERLGRLLEDAIGLEAADRRRLLTRVSADDPALGRELRSLLEAHARPGPLDRPAPEWMASLFADGAPADDDPDHPGEEVGPYRVGQRVGGVLGSVYRAHDERLGRDVALKLLPLHMSRDAVARDRFMREARSAASLEHPNICTILDMGRTDDGRMYLVMPFYRGETLEALLARGPLAVETAVGLALQVARGLSAAHRRGIVHRDIKPGNIMLTEDGGACVLDFGVAKLAGATLTGAGARLGTAAYMSPEQVRAGEVDARSDIWALGATLYEMLAGERPFRGKTALEVFSAILHSRPRPIAELRADVPVAIASLLDRMLAEDPAERPPSMDEVGAALEGLSEGRFSTVSRVGTGVDAPEAVPPAAEASRHGLRPVSPSGGSAPGPRRGSSRSRGRHHLPLRITALAALLLVGPLGIRLLGRSGGAAAGSGPLEGDAAVVLVDFESPDPGLARAATEAFRIEIGQSRVVRLVGPERVAEALVRMGRDPHGPLDRRAARELARREGIPAVVEGAIHPAGRGYLLSASLLSTVDDAVLASHREVAEDSSAILAAIDALSGALRVRIGESARLLRSEPPLEQTTTSNLRALQSFSRALRALQSEGDLSLGTSLLEQAVELDSTFASAQATLGMVLAKTSRQRTRAVAALTRAYRHRDRLPRRERLWHAAFYREAVEGSLEEAARLYESLIELETDHVPASDRHDLHAEYADILLRLRADRRAEEFARRAIALDEHGRAGGHRVLAQALAYQGRPEEAESVVVHYLDRAPQHRHIRLLLGHLKASAFDHDGATEVFEGIRRAATYDPFFRILATDHLAALAAVQGRIARTAERAERSSGPRRAPTGGAEELERAARVARLEAEVVRRPDRARVLLESALERHPLTHIPLLDRPYLELAEAFALAGAPARARALLAEFERLPSHAHVDGEWAGGLAGGSLARTRGALALAEGRWEEAAAAYRAADAGRCRICALAGLGRAFDLGGRPDSAIAVYERYLRRPEAHRLWVDPFYLAPVHERLGQLYGARGDSALALDHLSSFATLWADADAVLRPRVEAAQARLRPASR